MTLFIKERPDGLQAFVEFNTDLFVRSTIERLIGHFQELLRQGLNEPRRRLSEIPLLTPGERRVVLESWSSTPAESPADGESLGDLFSRQASRTPEVLALIDQAGSITYAALEERSNRWAHRLLRWGVQREDIVALVAARSLDVLAIQLGIAKPAERF